MCHATGPWNFEDFVSIGEIWFHEKHSMMRQNSGFYKQNRGAGLFKTMTAFETSDEQNGNQRHDAWKGKICHNIICQWTNYISSEFRKRINISWCRFEEIRNVHTRRARSCDKYLILFSNKQIQNLTYNRGFKTESKRKEKCWFWNEQPCSVLSDSIQFFFV